MISETENTALNRPAARESSTSNKFYWIAGVLCLVLLQKFAIPIADNTLSINYITIPIVLAALCAQNQLRLDSSALALFSLFCACAFVSNIMGLVRENVSLAGFFLLCYTQIWFCFAPSGKISGRKVVNDVFVRIMFVLALAGICQFVLQGIIPTAYLFPVDNLVPESLLMQGYGGTQVLSYGSTTLKSNGVVFTEPAFFSQFIAIAIIVEIENKQRYLIVAVFLLALVFSFSGTGMIVLMFYGSYALIRQGRFDIVVMLGIAGLCVVFFGSALNIQIIINRIDEFTTPGTSGHARFLSIFQMIGNNQTEDAATLLFGFGSGQIIPYIKRANFTAFDPTWGKVFFEYGVIGFSAYVLFLWKSLRRFRSPLFFPCLLIYSLLGGYLVDPNIIATFALFTKWASMAES